MRFTFNSLRCALPLLMATGLAFLPLITAVPVEAQSRIKDIVDVEGVRDNMLVGYGLVVGLDGSGDTLTNSPFTEQSLVGMLERLGVNIRSTDIRTANVAAVMVTATLPPFATQGTRIDVSVSSLGDASSLLGGTLLVTPLLGADGEVYAVAQGTMSVNGFSAQGAAASITRGVPTGGRIANGAIIEREIPFTINNLTEVRLALRNPDFTTAQRISEAVNEYLGGGFASPTDPSNVTVAVPANRADNVVGLVTEIEQLQVIPDTIARVVVDETTGVIVMGENVRINTVAIAQGNLTIRITETPQVSQPNPFAEQGETVVVPRTEIEVDDDSDRRLGIVDSGITLQELVESLNALGVGPRDMIAILQTIKASGALQAELEIL